MGGQKPLTPMGGTIAQQPKVLGATAVESALKVIGGGTVEKANPVAVKTVDAANVADFMK